MKQLLILCAILSVLCLGGCGGDAADERGAMPADSITATVTDATAETQAYTEAVTETVTEAVTELVISSVEPSLSSDEYDENGYVPISLMYHLVLETPYSDETGLFVRPSEFEDHLAVMNEAGYRYLFANDFNKTKEKSVVITFDDGYEDNYTNMFPILKKYGARATIFLITDMIDTPGYLSTAQIKEMSDSGYVLFGCHTESHRKLSELGDDEIRSELERSIAKIEAITGKECDILAYPSGDHDERVCAIASEYVKYAYLAKPRRVIGGYYYLTIPRIYAPRGFDGNQMLDRMEGRA